MISGRLISGGAISGPAESKLRIEAGSTFRSGLVNGAISLSADASVSLNWDFRVFVATRPFITGPDDALANTPFRGALDPSSTVFERSIMGSKFGRYGTGLGEITITGIDGEYDYLAEQYAIAGRRIVIKAGVLDSYDNFATILDCVATGWKNTDAGLLIELRDKLLRLEVPAQPNTYLGTGGVEGTADLTGKRKPRALGENNGIEPPLVLPNTLTYQVNDGPVQAISNVYVRGAAMSFGADHATWADLQAASIADASYHTCLALGYFRLAFANTNELRGVRVDVLGDKTGGTYIDVTSDIVHRLIVDKYDSTEIDEAAFAVNAASQPASVGIYLGPDDQSTIADVAANLMDGIGGWIGDNAGRITLGILTAPTGTPVERLTSIHWKRDGGIDRDDLPSELNPPPKRFRVAYERLWATETDFAGIVTADRRAYLQQQYRLATTAAADAVAIVANYPLAQDPDPIEAYFADLADAQAEADRRLDLFSATRSLYRLILLTRPYTLQIGDVIHVTYDRWDLTAGRLMRVVKIRMNLNDETVEVWGFG